MVVIGEKKDSTISPQEFGSCFGMEQGE